MTTEYEKARAWREARGLTVEQLAEATGYAPITIYWFERGEKPPRPGKESEPVEEWVFRRYRMSCAGVEYRLRNRGVDFAWGE